MQLGVHFCFRWDAYKWLSTLERRLTMSASLNMQLIWRFESDEKAYVCSHSIQRSR